MKHVIALLYVLFALASSTKAQRNEILAPNIASLQVIANNDWMSLPVITLDNGEYVTIGFDELSHVVHRYCYKIEHCEADWTTSEELFESDFVNGFATGNTIDDAEQSINTNTLYTHYAFTLPNDKCAPRLSGNYRVTVYDENNDSQPVLTACFMIVEPGMKVGLSVTSNTDIDINHSHQQVSMSVDYGGLRVTDPATQIRTVILQNERWDNAVVNAKPQYVRSDGLMWDHNRDLIFPAGNEYRKFEMLDVTHTTMGLESIKWDGQQYHAWVWPDEPRPSYVYDEDANGAFVIRNSDNEEINTTSDYAIVHFRLRSPRLGNDIYLNGNWTNDRFLPAYRMEWNAEKQQYEGAVPLKQGYYSYQYLQMTSDGTLQPIPSEGSFYQTENKYQALIYYRGQGQRTDRLVGYGEVGMKPDGSNQ